MRKILLIASALAVLGAGSAAVQAQSFQAANAVQASNPNQAPGDLGPQAVYTGEQSNRIIEKRGYSAADDFRASSHNGAPVDRFAQQTAPANVDRTNVTAGIRTFNTGNGYSAADSFAPSDN
jgi:hypothetical protein